MSASVVEDHYSAKPINTNIWSPEENRILAIHLNQATRQKPALSNRAVYSQIASAIKTKSVSQVTSRVEKYVIKFKGLDPNYDCGIGSIPAVPKNTIAKEIV